MIRKLMHRFLTFAVALFLVSFPWFTHSQDIEIDLKNRVFPILTDQGQTILAASEYSGLYPPGIGGNLRNHPMNDGLYRHPEFLVLDHFRAIKQGNFDSLLTLYDSASRNILPGRINIEEAQQAYQPFADFELLSKAVFGDFVRIRYNLVAATGEGIPWILIARNEHDRYYLTETLSIDHLFIDISSVNPWNFNRDVFNDIDVSDLQKIYFEADGLQLKPVAVNNGRGVLGIFFDIQKYTEKETLEDIPPEVELLYDMKRSLQDTTDAVYLQLWDQRSREKLNSSAFYKNRILIQRQFYNQMNKLVPLGYLKAGNDLILFYKSEKGGQQTSLQLIPMKFEAGRYRLTMKPEHYYAWRILNNPSVMEQIEKYLVP